MTIPEVTIFWPCVETTPPTMQARPITASPGNIFLSSMNWLLLFKVALRPNPIATGIMVTINIDLRALTNSCIFDVMR